jgi:hypothetical protein
MYTSNTTPAPSLQLSGPTAQQSTAQHSTVQTRRLQLGVPLSFLHAQRRQPLDTGTGTERRHRHRHRHRRSPTHTRASSDVTRKQATAQARQRASERGCAAAARRALSGCGVSRQAGRSVAQVPYLACRVVPRTALGAGRVHTRACLARVEGGHCGRAGQWRRRGSVSL